MHTPLLTSIRQRTLMAAGNLRYSRDGDASSGSDMGLVWFKRFEAVFAVIAGLAVVFALIDTAQPLAQRLVSVPILSLIVVQYTRLILNSDARSTREALIYFVTGVPLLAVLIQLHPAYYLLVFAAYWQLFSLLTTQKAMVGATLLTIMMISLDSDDGPRLPFTSGSDWLVFGLSIILGGMMARFIHSLFVQSERRQLLIEELNTTRAQLSVQERRAGMLQERYRIAGDFHDTVAQDLASVVMHLEAAEAKLPPGAEPVRDHIRLARDTARSGLTEARRIVHALMPDILSTHSIADALRITSSRWSASSRTPCSFEVIGDPPALDRDSDVVLLRSLQEALTNVRKHANASSVVVTLTNLGDEVVLDVHDDGVGFDPFFPPDSSRTDTGEGATSGMGFVAMKERIHMIGGALSIESDPGSGTTVSIALPMLSAGQPEASQPLNGCIKESARV